MYILLKYISSLTLNFKSFFTSTKLITQKGSKVLDYSEVQSSCVFFLTSSELLANKHIFFLNTKFVWQIHLVLSHPFLVRKAVNVLSTPLSISTTDAAVMYPLYNSL